MNEQFEQFDVIGSGRYTVIYEGHDHGPLDRAVAIKQLAEPWNQDGRRQAAFLAEAKFLANQDYEHLLKVYDVDQGSHLVITELLEGSLDRWIEQEGPLDSDRVRSVLQQVLKALNYLHKKNILYGAIRPSKLLLTDRGKVKLSSFERIENGIVPKPEVEKYVAPETLSTELGNIGPALDLYCLAFTSLELLLGDRFDSIFPVISNDESMSDVGWLRWHSSPEDLPPVKKLVPGVADDVALALDQMLKKQASERPQTATDAFALLKDVEPIPVIDGVERSFMRGAGMGASVADVAQHPQASEKVSSLAKEAVDSKPASSKSEAKGGEDKSSRKSKTAADMSRKPAVAAAIAKSKRKKSGGLGSMLKALLLLLLLGGAGFGGWWVYQNDPYGWFKVAVEPPPVEPVVVKTKEPEPEVEPDMDSLFKLGKQALAVKNYDSAIEKFSTVLDHDHGKYLLAFLLRGKSFHGRKADDEDLHHAEEDFTAFLSEADSTATDPEKAEAHLLRGQIHRGEGDLDPAVADYRASIDLQPDTKVQSDLAQILVDRANAALDAEKLDPAITDLEEARTLDASLEGIDKKLASTRFQRGSQKRQARNFGAAKSDFDRAVELIDDEPTYYVARGESRGSFGEIKEGIRDYSLAIKISSAPEANWFVGRAGLHRKNRNSKMALDDLNRAIELAPAEPNSYAQRGRLYSEDLQKFDNAITDFRSALKNGFRPPFEINMAIGEALTASGEALLAKGGYIKAIKQFEESLKQYEIIRSEPNLTSVQKKKLVNHIQEAYRRQGDCYSGTRDYSLAIEKYTNAITESGDTDYEAYTRRGNCYRSVRKFDEARKDLSRALEINEKYRLARLGLGRLFITQGDDLARRRLSAAAKEKASLKQEALDAYNSAMLQIGQLIEAGAQTRDFDLIIAAATKINMIDTNQKNAARVRQLKNRKQQHLSNN